MGQQILVKAVRMGYIGHVRQRPDSEFFLDEALVYQKDAKGNFKLDEQKQRIPRSWLEVLEEDPRPAKRGQGQQQRKGVTAVLPNPKPQQQAESTGQASESVPQDQSVI